MTRRLASTALLMMISPVIGLIQALQNGTFKDKSYIRGAILIFTTIYGSTFSLEGIGDGSRHWQNVYDYYEGLSFHQFWMDIGDILLFKTNDYINEDLYIHVISYLSGSLLGLPGLFFVIVAFVYGYFFSGSMVRLFHTFPSIRKNFIVFVLALLFIALLNLQSMNTVRTWTGFWILFYACISYYQTKKWKYLLLLFIPPLVHIGYFLMAVPAWFVVFFSYSKRIVLGIYLVSFVTSFVEPPDVLNQLSKIEVGQEKIDGYYTEKKTSIDDNVSSYSQKRWYLQYQKSGIAGWCLVGITLVMIFSGIYTKYMNAIESHMFTIGLLTKVLSNSSWFLYALSNRADAISIHFVLAAILMYWQRMRFSDIEFRLLGIPKFGMLVCVAGLLPYFVFVLANTLEYLSLYVFVLPPVVWIDDSMNITLREILSFLSDF